VDWVRRQNGSARKSVKKYSKILFRRLVPYYHRPIMRQVLLTKRGVFLFFSDDKSYKVQILHPDGRRELVADSTRLGKDVVIQGIQTRKDGRLGALHYSEGGSDEASVKILDWETGKTLDALHGFIGDILWLSEDSFYYTRTFRNEKTPDGVKPPADRVFLRDGEKEEMVFGRGLPTSTFIDMAVSQDGSKTLLDADYGFTRMTPYGGDLHLPESWRPLYRETRSVVSNIDYADGKYFLLSFEKSCGEILSVSGRKVSQVIRESEWPLQDAALVGNNILCHYLVDACSELRVHNIDGKQLRKIKFDVPGSLIGIPPLSTHGHEAAFTFSSYTIPFRVYKLEGSRPKIILAEKLPGKYSVSQGTARSADGTRVHYFLATRKGVSPKKVLLFGYGGFRISVTPSFNPAYLPFLDDGGTYGATNLRGGLEHGEDWHKAGARGKKFNVFDDYLAVLAKLKREGKKVVGFGRSNGGLLMGATMNVRPDLFDGVLIGYPVLDMMRFHKLLLGGAWVPEYGNPENPRDREFLLKYSPYHNLSSGTHYPPIFIYTGLKDDRVHPAHAFKFQAKLREMGAHSALRVEMESGHIGASPETRMKEEADKLGFVYQTLEMTPGSS
jgi:prolyl oligopeptidase